MPQSNLYRKREQNFLRWWKKNKQRTPAHEWLCRHAKRMAHSHIFAPAAFDDVKFITKRFFNSDFKKLKRYDAWRLWRLTHPIACERIKVIERSAAVYEQMYENYKSAKSDKKDAF